MKLEGEGSLLRIYLGELDKWHHQPLYEAIVLKAREMGLAGATVLRGPMGFGANSHLHTAKILRLSEDLPILIEIVDKEEKINTFLPELDKIMGDGLVTLEKCISSVIAVPRHPRIISPPCRQPTDPLPSIRHSAWTPRRRRGFGCSSF